MNIAPLIAYTRLNTAITEKVVDSLITEAVAYKSPATCVRIDISSGVRKMPQPINQS